MSTTRRAVYRGTCPNCGTLLIAVPKRKSFPVEAWNALWKAFDKLMREAF